VIQRTLQSVQNLPADGRHVSATAYCAGPLKPPNDRLERCSAWAYWTRHFNSAAQAEGVMNFSVKSLILRSCYYGHLM